MSQKPTNTKDETRPDAQADLDARVASLLGEMDETHDRVVQRLDWPAGSEQDELDRQLSEAMASVAEVADAPPPSALADASVGVAANLGAAPAQEAEAGTLPRSLDEALSETFPPAQPVARVGDASAAGGDQGEGASESIASDVRPNVEAPAAKVTEPEIQAAPAPVAAAKAIEAPPVMASSASAAMTAAPAAAPTVAPAPKPTTITDLDNQLSQALAEPTEDEFADASEVLANEAPPVDLKAARATADAPVEPAPVTPQPAPVVAAVQAPSKAAPATDDELEAPVKQAAPAAPVAKPVQAPAPKPAAKPAPKPAASDEPKLTLVDMFWRVATPIVEPIAGQLGRLPVKTQQTFAWIGMTTLFVACVTWGYVLFLMPTKPASHLLEDQEQSEQAAGGHGEHDEPAPRASAKAPSKESGKHASADGGHGASAAADEHAEPAPSGHGAAKSGGH